MKLIAIASAALLVAPALAQDAAGPSDEIVVTGRSKTFSLEGKRLRAAQRAFIVDRARFAPSSTLYFQARQTGARPLDGLTFALVRGAESIALPLDAQHRLVLPLLDSDDWRLVANRAPKEIGLRAWVFSPGASEADRPLGDMRLQCRVSWALQSDRYSIFQRAGFNALGGCSSSNIEFYTTSTRPVAQAQLIGPGAPISLTLRPEGAGYRMPIGDRTLANDIRLRLTYR